MTEFEEIFRSIAVVEELVLYKSFDWFKKAATAAVEEVSRDELIDGLMVVDDVVEVDVEVVEFRDDEIVSNSTGRETVVDRMPFSDEFGKSEDDNRERDRVLITWEGEEVESMILEIKETILIFN